MPSLHGIVDRPLDGHENIDETWQCRAHDVSVSEEGYARLMNGSSLLSMLLPTASYRSTAVLRPKFIAVIRSKEEKMPRQLGSTPSSSSLLAITRVSPLLHFYIPPTVHNDQDDAQGSCDTGVPGLLPRLGR